MKWVRAGMLLCMLIFLVSYAAENNTETAPKQDAKQASSSEAAAEMEYEEGNMRREFCTVESLQEDYFVLENTKGERYHIDNSLRDNFEIGDEVLLIYTDRRSVEDGAFEAEVRAVYPDSSRLLRPSR